MGQGGGVIQTVLLLVSLIGAGIGGYDQIIKRIERVQDEVVVVKIQSARQMELIHRMVESECQRALRQRMKDELRGNGA